MAFGGMEKSDFIKELSGICIQIKINKNRNNISMPFIFSIFRQ